MYEWHESVQKMIEWIEEHIQENPTLLEMSKQIGYSPYYCSAQFHQIVGMTLKNYMAGRRLCYATIELRDTKLRILDVAVKYGFSSQEAFTRAFVNAFGCTPNAYRKNPKPIKLAIKRNVFFPQHYQGNGENDMEKTNLKAANFRFEYIPAHQYIGIWDINAKDYCDFWTRHNCDDVCGIIDSLSNLMDPVVTAHTAGWFYENGARGYFYGLGVPADYAGEIPELFECRTIPASYYIVFFHPPFDYIKDNSEVMNLVETLTWNFNPKTKGYEWNDVECPNYQRHYPEVLGYEVLRPVKKI